MVAKPPILSSTRRGRRKYNATANDTRREGERVRRTHSRPRLNKCGCLFRLGPTNLFYHVGQVRLAWGARRESADANRKLFVIILRLFRLLLGGLDRIPHLVESRAGALPELVEKRHNRCL